MKHLSGNIIAGAAALLVGAPAGYAATITVDDFTTDQFVQDLPGTQDESSLAGGSMFGGTRYLEVFTVPPITGGTQLSASNPVGGNAGLSFNNGAGSVGAGYVVYDGDDNSVERADGTGINRPDATVLIGPDDVGVNTSILDEDIVMGSVENTFFSFDLSDFNPGTGGSTALFSAYAFDTLGNVGQFEQTVGAFEISPDLFLNEFSGDVDWTSVSALAFSIDSRVGNTEENINFDGRVGPIAISSVPLPASALMLLSAIGAVGGAGFVRRKKSFA